MSLILGANHPHRRVWQNLWAGAVLRKVESPEILTPPAPFSLCPDAIWHQDGGMDNLVTLSLTLPRPLVNGMLVLAGVLLASGLVYITLPEAKGETGPLYKFSTSLGLGRIHPVLMLTGLTLYVALVGILLLGLFGLIWSTLEASGRTNDYMFYVLRIGGLTAVLGAVIGLPFALIRLGLTERQASTAENSNRIEQLKLNQTAADNLAARRQITVGEGEHIRDIWQDDIVQRNSAIDRLEGLAREEPAEVLGIAGLLSVYVRELSAEFPPQDPPTGASTGQLKEWARSLPKLRSDMEKAAQTLSEMNRIHGAPLKNGEIALRGANLQRADLTNRNFEKARLNLSQMQGADLSGAQMQGANIFEAGMQGADLSGAQMQGADLSGAQMQGADLRGAQFDNATDLTAATLRGAAVKNVDFTDVPQIIPFLDDIFGDATTSLPEGEYREPYWTGKELDLDEFDDAWRAWQKTLPPGWDEDIPND
ncbi:MAG: pentapeptide repeat-containing protein [Pseudomonadota bacterium]